MEDGQRMIQRMHVMLAGQRMHVMLAGMIQRMHVMLAGQHRLPPSLTYALWFGSRTL